MRHETAALLLVACCLCLGAMAGVATADHGSENTDFTVTPGDRTPNASDVSYSLDVELTDNIGRHPAMAQPDRIVFSIPEATLETCQGSSDMFGSTTNYALYVQQYNGSGYERADYQVDNAVWDGNAVEFRFDPSDDQPEYSVDDVLTLELDGCAVNPETEDWYQGVVYAEGKSRTDRNMTFGPRTSHYFGICEGCESDADAESQLGRPPSATPTPTATPTDTPTPTATATDVPDTPDSTPEPTATPTETPTPTDAPTETDSSTDTATETESDDDDPPIDPDVFGMDPFVVVGLVAGVSITLASLVALRL